MRAHSRTVLTAAVVFAIAMSALESGGWWWAWLAATVLIACKSIRLPWTSYVKLAQAARYTVLINRTTRRYNRECREQAQRQRRIQRQQRRTRRRQAG
jgi:hypothetical protein